MTWCVVALVTAAACRATAVDDAQLRELLKQGQFEVAEPLARARVEARADDAYAKYYLGYCLIGRYRWKEAEAVLDQAVKQEPGHDDWLYTLAKARVEQGRNQEAMADLKRALALKARPEYHFALAACAQNLGQHALAESELRACLRDQPNHAEALYRLGSMLADRGEDAASLDYYSRAAAAQPGYVDARFRLGLAQTKLGQAAAAASAFEAVLKDVPTHVGALYNLGQTLTASVAPRRAGAGSRSSRGRARPRIGSSSWSTAYAWHPPSSTSA